MAIFQESQKGRQKVTSNLIWGLGGLVVCVWLGLSIFKNTNSLIWWGGALAIIGFGVYGAWFGLKGLFHTVLTLNDNSIEMSGNLLETHKKLSWNDISQATSTYVNGKRIILLIASRGRIDFILPFFEKSDEILQLINDNLEKNGKKLVA
jgi:hypothetical protein